MSNHSIEFSKITLISDNAKSEVEENINNKEKFQSELEKLKNKFNKLRLSTQDIINKKNFNFKEFLRNDLNIQLSSSSKNESKTNKNKLLNNSQNNQKNVFNAIKKINISDQAELAKDRKREKIIAINYEKDDNSCIILDKNINNNLTISSIGDNYFSSNDNYNIENNISLKKNNSNSSFNNNLFVVKIKSNKNIKKKLLGNKHNTREKTNNRNKVNKKENLVSQIGILFNKIKNTADKYKNYFQMEEKNDNRTIFIENKKIFDIYLFKGKINKIYSYEKNIYSNKEKDIIKQLNIIQDNFEKKLISASLNNKDYI